MTSVRLSAFFIFIILYSGRRAPEYGVPALAAQACQCPTEGSNGMHARADRGVCRYGSVKGIVFIRTIAPPFVSGGAITFFISQCRGLPLREDHPVETVRA